MLLPKDSPSRWNVDWTPMAIGVGMVEQICSPYWNPWAANPIGPIVESIIKDFDGLNRTDKEAAKLYVCATDVNKTALRIFGPGEITVEALTASTCYPTLYRAVKIDGSFYWDGGYMGNPALDPLVDWADDLLTVLIDPLDVEGGPPMTPRQIVNRINEVSFGSSWVSEMRRIELINDLLEKQLLRGDKYRTKRFHLIRNDRYMEEIGAASKLNPSRDFIYELRDRGLRAADDWVAHNFAKVGVTSTFDTSKEVALRLKGTADAVAAFGRPT
jgi:NTE family protein